MSIKRIDGTLFSKMLQNGYANLKNTEDKLNSLNVFPVADGDTGTNMCLTLESGLRSAKPAKELGLYLQSVSEGMLYGARGNSGVILSQLFRGFTQELARVTVAGPGEMRNALCRAYKTAYRSVVRPVEGTILTVSREGIENIRHQIRRDTDMEHLLSMYLAEMRKSLSYTPQLLSELKEANVVDSGAMGYIAIVEGMLKYLYGETLTYTPARTEDSSEPDFSLFSETSSFLEGYCMEFILQRLNDRAYDTSFRLQRYLKELETLGTSLVAVETGWRVKIHIHTRVPARVIELSQRYGEFLTFKLENMQLQHNEKQLRSAKEQERIPLAIVAVVNGDGMKELYSGIGCHVLLESEPGRNVSAQDFADAFARVNADTVAVLPNDKNVILAAKQAAQLSRGDNIVILPTRNMAEGYFALATDVPDSTDVRFRLSQLRQGSQGIRTLSLTAAARDCSCHGIRCKTGDCLAFLDDELVAVAGSWSQAICESLRGEDLGDISSCVIFRGKDTDPSEEDALAAAVGEQFPDLELSFLYGGQQVYPWLIGLV